MPNCTVIAVASAKGGVGKTTTSLNLGTAIAAHGLDVVVVELDLAMANVVDFLSLEFDDGAAPSMHDVLAGEIPVWDALYDAPGDITVAPSGTSLDALGSVDMSNLSAAVEALRERFDVAVLDTGAGVNSATTTSVQVADETVLVSTPRVASIRDTEKTRTIVEERGGEVGGLVLTQAGTGSSPGSERLTEFLGVDLLCTVPQDPTIHECQDAGVPIAERRPDSEAARAYAEGAASLVSQSISAAATDPDPVLERTDDGRTSAPQTADDSSADRQDVPDSERDRPGDDPPSRETLEAQGWTFPGEEAEDATSEEAGPVADDGTDADIEADEGGSGTQDTQAESRTERPGATSAAAVAETEGEPEATGDEPESDFLEDSEIVVAEEDYGIPSGDEDSEIVVADEQIPDADSPDADDSMADDGEASKPDAAEPESLDSTVQPLTTDGGGAALPDEAIGSASPRDVDVPTPSERFLAEMRSAREHVEGEGTTGESADADELEPADASPGGDDADDTKDSLSDRVSSLFSRSE